MKRELLKIISTMKLSNIGQQMSWTVLSLMVIPFLKQNNEFLE